MWNFIYLTRYAKSTVFYKGIKGVNKNIIVVIQYIVIILYVNLYIESMYVLNTKNTFINVFKKTFYYIHFIVFTYYITTGVWH